MSRAKSRTFGTSARPCELGLEQQRPAVSQTRRAPIIAVRETHIATLQAFTISRWTTRALYTEPPPMTIAILPARP
jgi:hypothetical protein